MCKSNQGPGGRLIQLLTYAVLSLYFVHCTLQGGELLWNSQHAYKEFYPSLELLVSDHPCIFGVCKWKLDINRTEPCA